MSINRAGPEGHPAYQAIVFLAAMTAAVCLSALYKHNPRAAIELKAEDAVARLAPHAARTDVVIVGMDDASVTRYGPVKSWPRSLLARGLEAIERGKPKVVVVDMALDRRTHTGDADLWRVMANNRNVVLGMAYDEARSGDYTADDVRSLLFLEKYAMVGNFTYEPQTTPAFIYLDFEPPMSDFAGSSRGIGVFDRETDTDGTRRTARLMYLSVVRYPAGFTAPHGKFPQSQLADGAPVVLPNLALVASLRTFDVSKDDVELTTGKNLELLATVDPPVIAPIDDQGRMLIRFAGPAGRFKHVPFADVVDGNVPASAFAGKVVLIGATATGDSATDAAPTPFGIMARVEVTANALSTLLDRSYFTRSEHRVPDILLLFGLTTGIALMFVSGVRAVITGLVLIAVYLFAAYGAYAFGSVMLPVLPPITIVLFTLLVAISLSSGIYIPIVLREPNERVLQAPEHEVGRL